ncbi:MAG: ABC transporter permease [Anaerolineae bacterium]
MTQAVDVMADEVAEGFTTEVERPPRSLTQLAWRRFRRHKMALCGAFILSFIVLYIIIGSFIFSEAYANHTDLDLKFSAPSREHLFGTDATGRDILARTIYGGQISMMVGVLAVFISVVVGITVGALAGFYGGFVDSLLMRFTEAMLNIPGLFLLILAGRLFQAKIPSFTFLGRSFTGSVILIIVIIGLTSWMYLARIVRANFLSLKEQEFITAARCIGVKNFGLIFRHILPNSVAPIVVAATLGVANAILMEAYASYLGLGIQPPTASWGNMLDKAQHYLRTAPWLWIFPGAFILLTVLSINFLGDGLRDALDPRTQI